MQFTLTLNGETSNISDLRLLTALFNGASPITLTAPIAAQPHSSPMPFTAQPADDDDETPAAAGTIVGLDKNGLPWDERIHSSNGKKNGDGSWRSKRGLDVNTKNAVEFELRSHQPQPVAMAPMPVAAPVPMPQPVIPAAPVAVAPVAAIPQPVTPVPIAQPQPAAATVVVDFMFILNAIQRGVQNGVIAPDYVGQLAAAIGVTDISQLNGNNDLCWKAYEKLSADGKYVAG